MGRWISEVHLGDTRSSDPILSGQASGTGQRRCLQIHVALTAFAIDHEHDIRTCANAQLQA